MFDFGTVIAVVVGAGSLAFSLVEYALKRKNKLQKAENNS